MPGHLYEPGGSAPLPGMLVLHTLAGPGPNLEAFAKRIRAIRAPLLIHHGEADVNVPVEQARLLHRAMLAASKSSSLYTYPGADHLFNFSIGPDVRFHPVAAALSWDRTVRFLDQHLKTRQ